MPRGSLGNLIKLPLGLHKRTARRARFIQPDGEPYADQLAFLEQVARASRRAVYGLIQRLQAQKSREAPAPWAPTGAPAPCDPVMAPEPRPQLPAALEVYNLDLDPQFQYLVSKCEVLQAIAEKVNRTYTLSNEETLVLIHTLGHLEHGPEAVNELFQRCLNADPALFLKSRLRGHPMSCPKIRFRVPHLTSQVSCNCPFELGGNLYPTPLIHLQGLQAAAVAPSGLTLDSLQFQSCCRSISSCGSNCVRPSSCWSATRSGWRNFLQRRRWTRCRCPWGSCDVKREKGAGSLSPWKYEAEGWRGHERCGPEAPRPAGSVVAILYVSEQGAALVKRGNRLVVEKQGQTIQWVHAFKIEQVVLMGAVSLSPGVIAFLLQEGLDTVFLSLYGKYRGRLISQFGKTSTCGGSSFRSWPTPGSAWRRLGVQCRENSITAGCCCDGKTRKSDMTGSPGPSTNCAAWSNRRQVATARRASWVWRAPGPPPISGPSGAWCGRRTWTSRAATGGRPGTRSTCS